MVALIGRLIYNTGIRIEGAGMMKRLAKYTALVLAVLSVFVCVGLAEGIDISSLSDDDLLAMNESIDREIEARGLSELSVLPAGVYVVGKDIKDGNYCLVGKDRASTILVFSKEAFDSYVENGSSTENQPDANPEVNFFVNPGTEGFIGLEEGQVLKLFYPCYIEEADESWMP